MSNPAVQEEVRAALREGSKSAADLVKLVANRMHIHSNAVRKELRRLLERGEISVGSNLQLKITPERGPRTLDSHIA